MSPVSDAQIVRTPTVTDFGGRFDDLVSVEVGSGDDRKASLVFASILTTRSKFFQKAFSSGWKEAEERVVKLPEVEPSILRLYLHHLLHGNHPVAAKGTPSECPTRNACLGRSERLQLSKLYVLAELLQDIATKNNTLKAFVHSVFTVRQHGSWMMPGDECTRVMYQGTPPNSLMRRLLVDMYSAYERSRYINEHEDWPKDFLYDLAVKGDGGLAYMETEEATTEEAASFNRPNDRADWRVIA